MSDWNQNDNIISDKQIHQKSHELYVIYCFQECCLHILCLIFCIALRSARFLTPKQIYSAFLNFNHDYSKQLKDRGVIIGFWKTGFNSSRHIFGLVPLHDAYSSWKKMLCKWLSVQKVIREFVGFSLLHRCLPMFCTWIKQITTEIQ